MTETEALNYAIFAMNTLLEPDASEERDVEQLFEYAPAAIDVLVARRDALKTEEQAATPLCDGVGDPMTNKRPHNDWVLGECPSCGKSVRNRSGITPQHTARNDAEEN